VHRSAQVAVAAERLIELLLVNRHELIGCERSRGLQTLEAHLAADTLKRHLAGRGAATTSARSTARNNRYRPRRLDIQSPISQHETPSCCADRMSPPVRRGKPTGTVNDLIVMPSNRVTYS
jgi:hypothetical protein